PSILSPLRSRINGGGYEVLVETVMPDTPANRTKLIQFVAQEIVMDGKIPHATKEAVDLIVEEAHKRAKVIDNMDKSLTLRLRELGGLIRAAGDLATGEKAPRIEARHITEAMKTARPVEEQIKERYGSYMGGVAKDISTSEKESSPYHYWNYHVHDDRRGYG
ncbi:MAG: ATP-dependent Lon protease, partial [Candidatus Thermoplasmatota archaeon]|nr:ATP-dependent Lon protease [Candidatus Thermoplasmatota archaeon]